MGILGVAGDPVVAGIPFVVFGLSVVAGKAAFVGIPVIGRALVGAVPFVAARIPPVAVHIAHPVLLSGVPLGFLLEHLHH